MTNYPVGDFLIRVKNAVLARSHEVAVPNSKLVAAVAHALKSEGFLQGVQEKEGRIVVQVSYKRKEPIILNLRIVSKPGLRIYMSADELGKVRSPSIFIVSTPKGVMSSRKALKEGLGGEIIAEVF